MAQRSARLLYNPGTPSEKTYKFFERIEIGRRSLKDSSSLNHISLRDNSISARHCIVTQSPEGRFFIRDVSRNGTRVDGRRLVPNLEFELDRGQAIQVGSHTFLLFVDEDEESDSKEERLTEVERTYLVTNETVVTVLVGDIRGYTSLTQQFSTSDVYQSVRRAFSELERIVFQRGGTLKEYQGDAIFAFWEARPEEPGQHAIMACTAALDLNRRVALLAQDFTIWRITDFPLYMDWALATGPVLISSFGGDHPTGLSMVGDTVNLAFRLESMATDELGPILTCQETQALASGKFDFKYLGEVETKGRQGKEKIFSLTEHISCSKESKTKSW